jgi:hypothetical protein
MVNILKSSWMPFYFFYINPIIFVLLFIIIDMIGKNLLYFKKLFSI